MIRISFQEQNQGEFTVGESIGAFINKEAIHTQGMVGYLFTDLPDTLDVPTFTMFHYAVTFLSVPFHPAVALGLAVFFFCSGTGLNR